MSLGILVAMVGVAGNSRGDENLLAKPYRVYFGTYTGKQSKGIYRAEFHPARGILTNLTLAAETANPSFLALHPGGKFLYAVGEIEEFGGKKTGAISAFAIDAATGGLKLLNQQPSGGAGPCHLVVDKTGTAVLAANYGGGSVCSIPIGADGKLGEPASVIQHQGSSVNKARQQGPHAHSINIDAGNRFAMAADLGLDRVLVYRFDPKTARLSANSPPAVAVDPGAGPRHFAFHPKGKHAYVINEMTCTVTTFDYNAEYGVLTPIQTISTLPGEVQKGYSTAEVVVHPSGKFLYGSNRGHNTIVAFRIDPESGKLTLVGHQGDGIKTPRNFCLDPTGRYLLAANQDGDSVVVFSVDQETGALKATGKKLEVPRPVCIRFVVDGR
jgi:6-phosphogluconolactonase